MSERRRKQDGESLLKSGSTIPVDAQDSIQDAQHKGTTADIVLKTLDEKNLTKDMFKSKRKSVEEIWEGEQIPGVSDIVRFAPSACNSQPWLVKNDVELLVSDTRSPAKEE